jgi:hypothetical protein
MTIATTKRAFLKAIRDNVQARAKHHGIRLSKEALNDIVVQQAADACAGVTQRVLKTRLDELLGMC